MHTCVRRMAAREVLPMGHQSRIFLSSKCARESEPWIHPLLTSADLEDASYDRTAVVRNKGPNQRSSLPSTPVAIEACAPENPEINRAYSPVYTHHTRTHVGMYPLNVERSIAGSVSASINVYRQLLPKAYVQVSCKTGKQLETVSKPLHCTFLLSLLKLRPLHHAKGPPEYSKCAAALWAATQLKHSNYSSSNGKRQERKQQELRVVAIGSLARLDERICRSSISLRVVTYSSLFCLLLCTDQADKRSERVCLLHRVLRQGIPGRYYIYLPRLEIQDY
ncbi:hypothetical protein BZA05DRAFT_406342 [Tricharina praecox]|uniref:uncharacterized protein n=1 Tax=Tricharina praecox TaxID=43433 RepID=UPI0022210576|nr:uncharacterized protein BZA05DRAFT_406342 [Tricharina praecox]KAI5846700.1 hypothetical protein BZA05DRAFT_406342 [Tricharina praecox]